VRFPREWRAGPTEIYVSTKRKSGQRVAGGARDARTGPQPGNAGLAIAERLAKPIWRMPKLTAMGTPETERNIANKISRGGFTAAFFLQCLKAAGCSVLRLEEG
jgi:hypothetical protein